MTQFKDLEMLYTRFINLTKEVNLMIKNEDYQSATAVVEDKSKLIKKLSQAKKTTDLTVEQQQKFESLEQDMHDDYQKNISSLIKIQEKLGIELIKTKKKFKLGSVYSIKGSSDNGQIVDFIE